MKFWGVALGIGLLLLPITVVLNILAWLLIHGSSHSDQGLSSAAGICGLGALASLVVAGLGYLAEEYDARQRAVVASYAAFLASERQQKEENIAEQQRLRVSLMSYVSDSENILKDIRIAIVSAESDLDRAERDFDEGVFAPFWDAIERAANGLAQIDKMIRKIIALSESYRKDVPKLVTSPTPFLIGLDTLPYPTRTADRMGLIVRQAQRNFHFASIFEQRKTNKILTAGFANLADAIGQMSDRLESSIGSLTDSLIELSEENKTQTQRFIEGTENVREILASESIARRDHEKKQREMLDNIQRGRKPRYVYPKTF